MHSGSDQRCKGNDEILALLSSVILREDLLRMVLPRLIHPLDSDIL